MRLSELLQRNAFIVGIFVIVITYFVNGVKYLNMADLTDVDVQIMYALYYS